MSNITMSNSEKSANTREFTCDLCGKQFDTITDMEDHKRNHAASAPVPDLEGSKPEQSIDPDGLPATPVLLM